jgi:UDP-N-acetylglucosamine--N-acetylmuramyl-(pentapeptide) pyrophosphoryl-undecaprenol N-acetylglucosamine transferase
MYERVKCAPGHGRRHRWPHLSRPGRGAGAARRAGACSWLGGSGSPGRPSMESQLVPQHGPAAWMRWTLVVRGKGPLTLALLPLRLLRAFWQSIRIVRRVKPDVVVGLGGYITFPAA